MAKKLFPGFSSFSVKDGLAVPWQPSWHVSFENKQSNAMPTNPAIITCK
jgi:hypothetical protein